MKDPVLKPLNTENIKIDHPQPADLPEVHSFFHEVITDTFKQEGILESAVISIEDEVADLVAVFQKCFVPEPPKEHLLLARIEDQIVGTVGYGVANKIIQKALGAEFKGYPELKTVYVKPAFQRQGIGNRLCEAILTEMAAAGIVHYYLDSGYKRAQVYWQQKLGAPNMVLKDYWAKDGHHLIWEGCVPASL